MTARNDAVAANPVQRGSSDPLTGRCGAKLRKTDPARYCVAWPNKGTGRCWRHGSNAPQVKLAAERRVARDEALAFAQNEMARLGDSWVDVDPLDGLLRLYQEAEWNVVLYRVAISTLAPDVARSGAIALPEQVIEFEKGGTHVPAAVHILVKMYDDERDRAARYAKSCIDAGVDVKRVRLEEARVEMLVGRMVGGLDAYRKAAAVDDHAHQAGLAALAKEMRR